MYLWQKSIVVNYYRECYVIAENELIEKHTKLDGNKMKNIHLSLYHKFVLLLIFAGLLPMGIICSIILNKMLAEYRSSVIDNYTQAVAYMNMSVNDTLKGYDDITKMLYYYDMEADRQTILTYGNYDNIRQILSWESSRRNAAMERFMNTIQSVDSSITAVHFIAQDGQNNKQSFHTSTAGSFLEDEKLFEYVMEYHVLSKTTRDAMVIPVHKNTYYRGEKRQVFTVARNYYNLVKLRSDNVYDYIGTLFIDVDVNCLASIYRQMDALGKNNFYIMDSEDKCLFSDESYELDGYMEVESDYNGYGYRVKLKMEDDQIFSHIESLKHITYLILVLSFLILAWGAVFFSKRLTEPIHNMMDKMAQIETGNFQVRLPVKSKDEIGILSKRFNQMSQELERYISQVYIAQLKQAEAEMTTLKSQIYPHFLYNTLEVIRMTAVEQHDEKVSNMIEALSVQMHYIIGTVQDMVPLGKEVEIVEKYIYLINCRIEEGLTLHSDVRPYVSAMVPKLILQPIVENAYIHGIKPRNTDGDISIGAEESDGRFIITVMDNGIGMDERELDRIRKILEGDEIGIKNEHNWQSVGLKNVHDRIRHLYGREYGLKISSEDMVGTSINIILPLSEKKEKVEK